MCYDYDDYGVHELKTPWGTMQVWSGAFTIQLVPCGNAAVQF